MTQADGVNNTPRRRARRKTRHDALIGLIRLRRQARAEVERLIDFLDATEIDADLEDDGTAEPSLSGVDINPAVAGVGDDREHDLGTPDRMVGQTQASRVRARGRGWNAARYPDDGELDQVRP